LTASNPERVEENGNAKWLFATKQGPKRVRCDGKPRAGKRRMGAITCMKIRLFSSNMGQEKG
jgi:hypothetical protein